MGAVRMAPTYSVDVHANMPQFHLLVERMLYQAMSQIASQPKTHPLTVHATKAARKNVERCRAPLHEILPAFGMDLGLFEDIKVVRIGPKWVRKLQI